MDALASQESLVSNRSWQNSKKQSKKELHSEEVPGNILQKDTSNSAIPERSGTLTSRMKVSGRHFELVSNSFFI